MHFHGKHDGVVKLDSYTSHLAEVLILQVPASCMIAHFTQGNLGDAYHHLGYLDG
jgi:hypothetical protein